MELALRFAVQMEAESQSLLEVPDSVDHGVGWSEQFVAGRRDVQCELANAAEFSEECFRIQQPGIGHFLGWNELRIHHGRVCARWRGAGKTSIASLTSAGHEGEAIRFYMTYIV